MKIVVLCTGRNGSVTFSKACTHIENYSVGHESYTQELGEERFDFPENHIEIDNRLCWHVGEIDKYFGNDVMYVYLKRNKQKVRDSFKKRLKNRSSIISAYAESIKMVPPEDLKPDERTQIAEDYIETIESNVDLLWKDKDNTMVIRLEDITSDFKKFWNKIKAEGDLDRALDEFNKTYNKSKSNSLKNILYSIKKEAKRLKFITLDKP